MTWVKDDSLYVSRKGARYSERMTNLQVVVECKCGAIYDIGEGGQFACPDCNRDDPTILRREMPKGVGWQVLKPVTPKE